jgi:hypothetical protein
VREITRSAGWRWRKARKLLTSQDPDYRRKVQHIQTILGGLTEQEAFFSIDEFGPFSIRAQGGKALAPPGQTHEPRSTDTFVNETSALHLRRSVPVALFGV